MSRIGIYAAYGLAGMGFAFWLYLVTTSSSDAPTEKRENGQKETKNSANDGKVQPAVNIEKRPLSESHVIMHELVLPQHTNPDGFCTGGQILSWMDLCAGAASKAAAISPCVTASFDSVNFVGPAKLGDVVILYASVNRAFRTSMEIGVRVEAEDLRTGERVHCCSAYVTFVSIDRQRRKPCPVHQMFPETEGDQKRFDMALERREFRLANRIRYDTSHHVSRREEAVRYKESEIVTPRLTQLENGEEFSKAVILPEQTMTFMSEIVLPNAANTLGVTFGGMIMMWMDQCAYVSACRVARNCDVRTAGVHRLNFVSSTNVGDIVYFNSEVTAVFNSSIEVMVSVYVHRQGEVFFTNDAFFTYVAFKDDERFTNLPKLHISANLEAKERFAQAEKRRDERLKQRALHTRDENRAYSRSHSPDPLINKHTSA
eukprot:Clim_evm52s210 gene=Clim_evmTU52s210